MPAFESSDLAAGKRLIWESGVKNLSHAHIDIYGDYWERFNTMRVPILGEDRFLEIALELEHVAKDEEDLERLLTKRKEEWEKEAKEWLRGIAMKSWTGGESFQCEDASDAAYRASMTGSLQHFLELLNGVAHGWEPDEVKDETLNDTDVINPNANTQDTSAEAEVESETMPEEQVDYETYMRQKLASKDSVYEPTYDSNVHKAPFFTSDQVLLIKRHFGKLKGKRSHGGDGKTPSSELSRDANASNLSSPSRTKKRPRFDDESSVVATEDTSQNAASRAIDRVTDESPARKRHRSNNDDDVNDGARKRQRRASAELRALTSQEADGSNARETRRRGPTTAKRQKRPILQTPVSSEPSASFPAVPDVAMNPPEAFAALTPRTNPPTPKKIARQRQNVTKKELTSSKKTNRVQKHTKRSSNSHNPNSSPISSSSRGTRAFSRRNTSSSLWELDSSGKPSQQ